jgi:molecular chaperone DnaJ
MATKRDYYDVLGVEKTASDAVIKSAYRKLALSWHPDRNKSAEAETKFKEINEAYEVLGNKEKRQTYDQFGHTAFDPSSAGGFGGFQNGPFSYSYTSNGQNINPEDLFGGGFSDPFEIFQSFFGGGGGFRQAKAKPHYSLKIDFFEAIKGIDKNIVHQGKNYTIKIPAGADSGTRIRFQDFDVSLVVQPHQLFKRDNNDVYIDHQIPFTLAILGGDTSVPTLDNDDLKIKIRSGTQPNTMIRLSGKGIKDLHGRGYGDFYIRLIINIPTKISRHQKDLLQEFEAA